MNDHTLPVAVTILGKEYRIACETEERDELLASARRLDREMRGIRDSGRIIGMDRIAVMAALNIAHELSLLQKQNHSISMGMTDRLAKLREKIDSFLPADAK